jgi:hypothetical protein
MVLLDWRHHFRPAGEQPTSPKAAGVAGSLTLIRVLHRGLFGRISSVTCGTTYRWRRWEPLGSDGVWPKRGPGTSRSWGSGAPHRGPWLARRPPPAVPDKRAPPGNRLVRGSPGGVWARDIPYVGAVPATGMGTPAPYVFKPCARWWVTWTTWHPQGRSLWCSEAGARQPGRWDSNPSLERCSIPRRRDEHAPTCSFNMPAATARARPGLVLPDDVRTQRGPAPRLAPAHAVPNKLSKVRQLDTCSDRCKVRQSSRSWCTSSSSCKGGVP